MFDTSKKERIHIEEMIDSALEDPKGLADHIQSLLLEVGIDPNLETILSFVNGVIFGVVGKNIRQWEKANETNYVSIMERRSWELRQAIIKAMNQ